MTILEETARLVKDRLASEYEALIVERVMMGVFFTGVQLSNGAGGLSYTPVKDIPQAAPAIISLISLPPGLLLKSRLDD